MRWRPITSRPSPIAARRSEIGDIVKHGLAWELGHTLTLFLFAGAAIVLGHSIPGTWLQPLETAAGNDRVHFHRHTHGDGTAHIRAHSHAGEMCRTSAQPTSTRTAFAGARCWSD